MDIQNIKVEFNNYEFSFLFDILKERHLKLVKLDAHKTYGLNSSQQVEFVMIDNLLAKLADARDWSRINGRV